MAEWMKMNEWSKLPLDESVEATFLDLFPDRFGWTAKTGNSPTAAAFDYVDESLDNFSFL